MRTRLTQKLGIEHPIISAPMAYAAGGKLAAAVAADGDSTIRTTIVDIARQFDWPKPFTARVIKTRFTMDWHGREATLAEPATLELEEARYWKAFQAGDVDNTGVFFGEVAGLIRDVAPAGEILRRMVREAKAVLERLPPLDAKEAEELAQAIAAAQR